MAIILGIRIINGSPLRSSIGIMLAFGRWCARLVQADQAMRTPKISSYHQLEVSIATLRTKKKASTVTTKELLLQDYILDPKTHTN